MDYLMKLAAFFKPPVDEPESTTKIQKSQAATSVHKLAQAQQPPNLANKQQMTINLKIEKPDIILIEKTDDINTKAIVLNVSNWKLNETKCSFLNLLPRMKYY